jgi:HPt (histidine-containing phosphotransfer) domain-containing protein
MADATGEWITVAIDGELMPVVPEYLVNRHLDCDEIERLLAAGGMECIQGIGHRMKGSGGSFGFDEISVIGEELESAALVGDAECIRMSVVRLKNYLLHVSVTYI